MPAARLRCLLLACGLLLPGPALAQQAALRAPQPSGPVPGQPAAARPGFVPQGPATTDPSFRLVNRGMDPVQEIYVSGIRDRGWGRDRLGLDTLAPGRFITLRLPDGQCVNDIRVVFADGSATEKRRVDTCALSQMSVP